MAADARLDADDDVAILLDHLDGVIGRQQAIIVVFPDHDPLGKREDSGEGNIEIGENPRLRAFDDMGAETGEVSGPRAARIDQGGHGTLARHRVRRHAKRRTAPIDMGVQVDQARRHQESRNVPLLAPFQPIADRGDPSSEKATSAIRSIPCDGSRNPAAAQHQIMNAHWSFPCLLKRRREQPDAQGSFDRRVTNVYPGLHDPTYFFRSPVRGNQGSPDMIHCLRMAVATWRRVE